MAAFFVKQKYLDTLPSVSFLSKLTEVVNFVDAKQQKHYDNK